MPRVSWRCGLCYSVNCSTEGQPMDLDEVFEEPTADELNKRYPASAPVATTFNRRSALVPRQLAPLPMRNASTTLRLTGGNTVVRVYHNDHHGMVTGLHMRALLGAFRSLGQRAAHRRRLDRCRNTLLGRRQRLHAVRARAGVPRPPADDSAQRASSEGAPRSRARVLHRTRGSGALNLLRP